MNILSRLLGAFYRRLPKLVQDSLHDYHLNHEIKIVQKYHKKSIDGIRNKATINVIFLVIHHSVWKYEELFRRLEQDPRFSVKVVVIPLVIAGDVDMQNYDQTLNYFKAKDCVTVPAFDPNKNLWRDIKKDTQPDVVFFTNPHRLTYDQYYIHNFKDVLTCYVPYAFVVIHLLPLHYDLDFHHLLWRYFVETNTHKDYADGYSKSDSQNVVITGFPGLDSIFNPDYRPAMVWMNYNDVEVKKIIWAPHHSIASQGSGLDYSSFNEYSDFFIRLLQARNDIQIAFKPHPLLKEKLYNDEHWGVEKTNKYYQLWTDLPNGQLEEGAYIDLFYQSDAMIMDSASFIVEYLYFEKPIIFTARDTNIRERFNSFGQMVFETLYTAENQGETERFIDEIVLRGQDVKQNERKQFLKGKVLPENGSTASENIYSVLVKELCL